MTDDRGPGDPGGGDSGPPPNDGSAAAPPPSGNSSRPWLIGGGVIVILAIVAIVLVNSGDDDDTATTTTVAAATATSTTATETTTTAAETTTTAAAETTTTAAADTTTTAAATTTTVAETTTTAASGGIGGTCAIENLNLVTAGVLTAGTGDPAFPPWVGTTDGENFDDPTSQTGFEAAVVYHVARTLGFEDDQVEWVRTGFDEVIAPGPKDFDFNIQQYSITDVREEVVDFSDPYYTTTQALVTNVGSSIEGVTSIAELADASLGAQIGTTSLEFIDNVIQPSVQSSVYNSTIDAITALDAEQIDGIVVDLPTAFFITAAQMDNGTIVGQFETPGQAPDNYGMLFAQDNPLVDCVNQALTILRDDGTLAELAGTWLTNSGDIVTISG